MGDRLLDIGRAYLEENMLSFIIYSPDIKVESKDLEVRLMQMLRSKI